MADVFQAYVKVGLFEEPFVIKKVKAEFVTFFKSKLEKKYKSETLHL